MIKNKIILGFFCLASLLLFVFYGGLDNFSSKNKISPKSSWRTLKRAEDTGLSFTANDVIKWAELPTKLGQHGKTNNLTYGEADGRLVITDLVTILNGETLVKWLEKYSYHSHSEPLLVKASPSALEVDVRIYSNKTDNSIVITLFSDGNKQGAG